MTSVDKARIRDRLEALIATPSATGYETEAAKLVASWLPGVRAQCWAESMADLERDPDYPGREVDREWVHVVAAEVEGSQPGPTLVLTGHLDTVEVGVGWSHEPLVATFAGDRVYGLGACDMKAGVIAALEAFEVIAAGPRDFAGKLRFVAVSGEEDGGTGTLAAIRRGWSGDYVIVTEPTSGPNGPDVVVAHAGALTFTIEVPGKAAHGSMPAEGESALEHFWTVYQALHELEAQLNADVDHGFMRELDTPYATNVGKVCGGTWASNVMEVLTAELRVGVALHETIPEAEKRFESTLMEAIAHDPWLSSNPPRVERTGAAFGSASIDPEHVLVTTVADAAEAVSGRRPRRAGRPYGCDMALWQRTGGAAALVFGPGDVAVAHAADEWVSLDETGMVAAALVETASRLLVPPSDVIR